MKFAWLVVLFVLVSSTAGAQRQCKKGIPCGGSCISATKTCHIGEAPAPKTEPSPSTSGRNDPASPSDRAMLAAMSRGSTGSRGIGLGEWIASVDGVVYYSKFCALAEAKVMDEEAIYFLTESDAKAAGYRRSKVKGC